jgi:hypothetical protein
LYGFPSLEGVSILSEEKRIAECGWGVRVEPNELVCESTTAALLMGTQATQSKEPSLMDDNADEAGD